MYVSLLSKVLHAITEQSFNWCIAKQTEVYYLIHPGEVIAVSKQLVLTFSTQNPNMHIEDIHCTVFSNPLPLATPPFWPRRGG